MTTRGYITIIDNKKNVVSAAYSNADSYLDGLGLDVLHAYEKHAIGDLINDYHERYPEDLDMVDGIRRNWYIKDSKNKDDYFHDYCYEYNPKTDILEIYYFGKKALTVNRENIDLYRFIFQNDNLLYYPLALDKETMTLKKDYYKELRTIAEDVQAQKQLEEIIKNNSSVLYLNTGRIQDYGPFNPDRYLKEVYDSAAFSNKLKFAISKDFRNQFQVSIQTPFCRKPLYSSLSSHRACEKYIAELLRTRPDDIRGTMQLFNKTEQYKRELQDIMYDERIPIYDRIDWAGKLKNQLLEDIKGLSASASFIPVGCSFNQFAKEILSSFSASCYRAKEKTEKEENTIPLNTIVHNAEKQRASGMKPDIPLLTGKDDITL